MPKDSFVFPAEILRRQIAEVYKTWGMSEEHIEITTRAMVETDLRGIDSHGIATLPGYQRRKDRGSINPRPNIRIVKENAATAFIDADRSIGHPPAFLAMKLALKKAKKAGVGVVGVGNSNHYGAAGVYAQMAADVGMIGISMTNASALVVPTFGRDAYLGTNPIAFFAPGNRNKPFALDMATSTVASGKIGLAKRANKPIPEGWAVDSEGRPITDSKRASLDKRLTPLGGTRELGGHKGYGLAAMVEILSASLNGIKADPRDPDNKNKSTPARGHFVMAIDPESFCGGPAFREEMDNLMDTLRAVRPADPAVPVQVAGDQESKAYSERLNAGVPLTRNLCEEIRLVCSATGAPFLLQESILATKNKP